VYRGRHPGGGKNRGRGQMAPVRVESDRGPLAGGDPGAPGGLSAARHFTVTNTTIRRYEDATGNGLQPPLGYLTALTQLAVDQIAQQEGAPDQVRPHFVQQLETIRKRFYADDPPPLWTWTDLCRIASIYPRKEGS
jgi:hypothetical protein